MKAMHWTVAAQLLRRGGPISGRPVDPNSIDERVQLMRAQARYTEPDSAVGHVPQLQERTEERLDEHRGLARGHREPLIITPRPKPQAMREKVQSPSDSASEWLNKGTYELRKETQWGASAKE